MLLSQSLDQRLALFAQPQNLSLLRSFTRGIERENLRVNADGTLATTPHPKAFGSALTHDSITTDFSEALLEFITPPENELERTFAQLSDIDDWVNTQLGEELLWPASMPCRLPADGDIPVAQYGATNIARMKTIYRHGLGHRYGRTMQTIAGIHYNISLPESIWPLIRATDASADTTTAGYFALIRNFRRYSWLLLYLMGASPALCACFVESREHDLDKYDDATFYLPHATCLRMTDLGYQSSAQRGLNVCYNALETYIETLRKAISTPHPEYTAIGVKDGDKYRQLSDGLLQIENEFYSPIRPKRVTESGEIPLAALQNGGVQYVELRCIDVNPMLPLGIDLQQAKFLDAFVLYCAMSPSPWCEPTDNVAILDNLAAVAKRGREPGLQLTVDGKQRGLTEWGTEILAEIASVAALLDSAHSGTAYADSCAHMQARIDDVELTPSANIMAAMAESGKSYGQWVLDTAKARRETQRDGVAAELDEAFQGQASASLAAFESLESEPQAPFDEYLASFFEQYSSL